MRSQLADRLGVQVPQIVRLPPDVVSHAAAEEAIELADRYGLARGHRLDESQRFTLRAGLGERADGSWAAATVCDFEPRQNGKNDTCAARELAGLLLFGDYLQIHTAHEFATANESFIRMAQLFENWDDLRRRVAHIYYANGAQSIALVSGQRLLYKARTGGAGRGFAEADLLVYDEAQHLLPVHVAASGPSRLANRNSQSWYMGSGGLTTSANAWRMRKRALSDDDTGRFAYVEHTAEQVRMAGDRVVSERPEVLDREAWATANAAYGYRITDESLMSLYDELGGEEFARECLCVWDPEPATAGDEVIDIETWMAGCDPSGQIVDRLRLAFDVTPDRSSAAIGAAGLRADGRVMVDVIAHQAGTGWVAERLRQLRDRWGAPPVCCDPAGPAGGLLSQMGDLEIDLVNTREHAQACGAIYDGFTDGGWRHIGQPELTAALMGADKRVLGDVWLWSRKSSAVDICPLVAVTLAARAVGETDEPAEANFYTV